MPALRYVHRLLLGTWIGSLLFFGAVVAPALFEALTPAQAASVVHLLFPRLDAFTLGAGMVLLAVGFLGEGRPRGRALLRAGLVGGMTLLAAVSALSITPRMAALRARAGGALSELSREDPVRREFGRLHGVSSGLMLGQVLLGLVALGLPLERRRPQAGPAPARPQAVSAG